MKLKLKFICGLLISVLFLQNIAVFADMHHAKNMAADATIGMVLYADDNTDDIHNSCDCEYCCHGYCSAHLISFAYYANEDDSNTLSIIYHAFFPPAIPGSLFRPPIYLILV